MWLWLSYTYSTTGHQDSRLTNTLLYLSYTYTTSPYKVVMVNASASIRQYEKLSNCSKNYHSSGVSLYLKNPIRLAPLVSLHQLLRGKDRIWLLSSWMLHLLLTAFICLLALSKCCTVCLPAANETCGGEQWDQSWTKLVKLWAIEQNKEN